MNAYSRRHSVGSVSGAKGYDDVLGPGQSLSGSLAFTCPVCIKSYRKEKQLQVHMQEHIEDSLHRCQHCSKTYSSASKLKTHQSEHVTIKQKFKCEDCGKMFLDVSSLNYHKQSHEKNGETLPCKDCQLNNGVCFAHYKTKVSADLQQTVLNGKESGHQNGKDKGSKSFLCKKCNKSFSDRLSLKKHKKDDHSSQRENVCKICNRAFQSNKQLTMHATFHNTDGAWECFYCHKKFNRAWKMKLHMGVSHTGKRPYICRFCGDDFLYPGNIMTHMKTVHNIWIVCKECGEPCESDDILVNHVCKVYQCKDCCASFETMEKLSDHTQTCDIKQMPSPTASCVPEVSQSTVVEQYKIPNGDQDDSSLNKTSHLQNPQSPVFSFIDRLSAGNYQGMLTSPVKQSLPVFSQAHNSPEMSLKNPTTPSYQQLPITPSPNKNSQKTSQPLANFPNIQPKPPKALSPPAGSPLPIFPYDKFPGTPNVPPLQQITNHGSYPSTVLQQPSVHHPTGAQILPIPGLIPLQSPMLPVNLPDSARTNFQNILETTIQNNLKGPSLNDLQMHLRNGMLGNFQNGSPANILSSLPPNLKNMENFQQIQATIAALYTNTATMQAMQTLPQSPLLQPSAAAVMSMLPALQSLQQSSAVAALQSLQQSTTTSVQSLQVPPTAITNSDASTSFAPSNSPMDLSKMSRVANCDTTTTAVTKDTISLSPSNSASSISNRPEPANAMDLCNSNNSKEYGGDGPTSMVSEPDPEIPNGLKVLAATNIFARPSLPVLNNHHHSDFCCSKDKSHMKTENTICSSSPKEALQSDEIDKRPIVIHMHRPNGKAKSSEGSFYITKEDAQRLKLRKEHMERKKQLDGNDVTSEPNDFSLKAWLSAERSNANKREDFVFRYEGPRNGSDSDRKESRIRLELSKKQLKKKSEMSFEDLLQI